MVMSGLLSGVLLARTLSGLVAGLAGWRTVFVFVFAAVAMAVLALALWRAMPRSGPRTTLRYRALLASIGALILREPVLRRRMVFGACGYAGFSLVWTTLTFLLSDPPFDFGEATIGLFGLAGRGGGAVAMRMGRRARPRDRRPRHHRLRHLELHRRAIGSAAGAIAWSADGWLPVCAVGFRHRGDGIARLADRAAPALEATRATGPSGHRRPRVRRSVTRHCPRRVSNRSVWSLVPSTARPPGPVAQTGTTAPVCCWLGGAAAGALPAS